MSEGVPRVDFACSFGVEEVEGLSELLDLVLGQSRPLDSFLGSSLTGSSSLHFQNLTVIIQPQ